MGRYPVGVTEDAGSRSRTNEKEEMIVTAMRVE